MACVYAYVLGLAWVGAGGDRVAHGPVPAWVEPAALGPAVIRRDLDDDQPAPRGRRLLLQETQLDARGPEQALFRRDVWRVLDPLGLENGSEVSIEYNPSYQTLVVHRVALHRGAAVLDRFDPDGWQILQREQELESRIFDGRLTALSILPDVRVGDVLELSYTLNGSHPTLAGRVDDSFSLASDEPIAALRYRLLVPAGSPLRFSAAGAALEPERRAASGGGDEYLWERENIPAVSAEDGLPADIDPLPYVELTSFEGWGEVRRWAQAFYAAPRQLPAVLDERARELAAAAGEDPERRALACLRFVRDEVRYLGIELGAGSYVPTAPEVVLERRFGDCKDKVFLLVTLLRALGLEAQPALVNSVAGEGLPARLSAPSAFDHMVLRLTLDGREYWIDPTDARARGRLERMAAPDLGWALVLDGQSSELTPIPAHAGARAERRVEATYAPAGGAARRESGAVRLDLRTTYLAAEADAMRDTLAHQAHDEFERAARESYQQSYPGLRSAGPLSIEDDEDEDRLVVIEHYRIPDFWARDGGRASASFAVPELAELLPAVPSGRRSQPFAFDAPDRLACAVRADIGPGWHLEGESETIEDDALRFQFRSRLENGALRLDYELVRRAREVQPRALAGFADDVERIRTRTDFALERGGSAEDWLAPALGLALGLGAAAIAALGALGLRLRLGPRLGAPLFPFRLTRWFTLFSHPGATFARALAHGSAPDLLLLIALSGTFGAWSAAALLGAGQGHSTLEILCGGALLGAAAELLALLVAGAVFAWLGRRLGGSGGFGACCTVLAHAQLPAIAVGFLWVPAVLVFGAELFATAPSDAWIRVDRGLMSALVLVAAASAWLLLVPAARVAHRLSLARACVLAAAMAGFVLVLGALDVVLGLGGSLSS